MITKQDRVYYTDPVPTSVRPDMDAEGPVELLVTRQMYKHHDIQLGDIVEVENPHISSRELWFTTTVGGRTVQGHVVNRTNRTNYSGRRIGLFTDDLFAYLILNDHENNVVRGHVSRWSVPNLPNSIGGEYGLFPRSAPAATWARDLMPLPGDPQDVIDAKIKRAKAKWEHAHKALRILDQSDQRGWGHHIETLRSEWGQFLPVRRYDVEVEGRALIPVHEQVSPELVAATRRRFEGNGAGDKFDANAVRMNTHYVSMDVPRIAVAANQPEDSVDQAAVTALFASRLRQDLNDYNLQAILTSYDSVLRSATF